MLDQNDYQSIRELVRELLDEQEMRLTAKIEEVRKSAVQEAVEQSVQYMNVLYETKFEPQFKLLAEGQQTLLETLAPKSRVEAVEEELAFLKTVVSALNKEVAELKKAI